MYNKNISSIFSLDEKTFDEFIDRHAHEYKTSHEVWFDTKFDITHLRSFDIICYANFENIKRLDVQNIQCRLLEYEVFNQYLIYNFEIRTIYRAIHVMFDDYTKSFVMRNEENDFAYLSFDFNSQQSHDEIIVLDNQFTISNFTNFAFSKVETNDLDQKIENTISDAYIESKDENSSNANSINFENQNSILQSTILFASSNSIAFSSSRRSIRQQVKLNFAHINSLWNKHFDDQSMIDSNSANDNKRFASKMRKIRKIDLNYHISENWIEVQTHFDKKMYVEVARKEINHHKINEIWKMLTFSSRVRIIFDRWIFSIKRDVNNEIIKYKTRWMTKDFRQMKNIVYFEIYFEVVKLMIWKCMLILIVKNNWETHHIDIVNAFFETNLKNKQWMKQSHDFEQKINRNIKQRICRLDKAFYELKQSFRKWYDCFKAELISLEYQCLKTNNYIFKHVNEIIISMFVNDMFIIESHLKNIIVFKTQLSKRFRIKDLKDVFFYLEIKVIRNREFQIIWLSQSAFIKQLIKNCDFENCSSTSISMKQYTFKINIHNDVKYKIIEDEIQIFRIILELLQWLIIMIRSNIAYAINKLSTYIMNSILIHSLTLQRIVRYLTNTMKLEFRFEFLANLLDDLLKFANSLFVDDFDIFRFHNEYAFMLWNEFVLHFFKRQTIVIIFIAEIEYMKESNAIKKAYFLQEALIEIDHLVLLSVQFRTNN